MRSRSFQPEIHVHAKSYWNGIGIAPTVDLAIAKEQFESSGFKIGIPTGVYVLVGHDNEIALLRPLRDVHPLWARWFWVTSIRNLIRDREIFSDALPLSTSGQTLDRLHIHPDAPAPKAKIWRYMSLVKFEKMLDQQGIFLSRADQFPDSLEGTLSDANKLLRNEVYHDDPKMAQAFSQFADALKQMKKWTYISCWRVDENESSRCWEEYKAEVAVQTTYGKLARYTNYIPCDCVRYIDFKDTWVFEGTTLMPFTHKDRSFEWEKELRIVAQLFPKKDLAFGQTEFYDCEKPNPEFGKVLPVDLPTFVERIVIAPNASAEVKGRIENLATQHGLNLG